MSIRFFILLVCFYQIGHAQTYREQRRFTNREGLAGNKVYRCMEDHQGYLWICTGSGISKFDGQQFQNFTTENGLPDNEVLQVMVDNDDRVWVSCFGKGAAYFDQVKNRFINEYEDTLLRLPKISGYYNLSRLPYGGVEYNSTYNTIIFNHHKKETFLNIGNEDTLNHHWVLDSHKLLRVNYHRSSLTQEFSENPIFYIVDKVQSANPKHAILSGKFASVTFEDFCIYALDQNGKRVVRVHLNKDYTYKKQDSFFLHESSYRMFISKHYLFTNAQSGSAEAYNLDDGKFAFRIQGDFTVNAMYEDRRNNLWVSTRNNGLLFFSRSSIQSFQEKIIAKMPVYSIFFQPQGSMYFGLLSNEVLEIQQNKTCRHHLGDNTFLGNVYTMISKKGKMYAFSENSSKVRFNQPLHVKQYSNVPLKYKCAYLVQDSVIILGGYRRLDELNTRTDSLQVFIFPHRVNACAAKHTDSIWLGTIEGLCLLDKEKKVIPYSHRDPLFSERITSLCFGQDDILWVSTAAKGVYAVKDNKIMYRVDRSNGLISNQTNKIYCDSKNQIWIATDHGVSVLRNIIPNRSLQIQNFTKADGVNGNEIYCFFESNNLMYVGTDAGVSSIPLDLYIPPTDIPVAIHRVLINQHDTMILPKYNLPYNQRSLSLFLGGIDISGHFLQTQYRLLPDKNWIALEGNTLNINLSSGAHTLELRAIDLNGIPGKKIRSIQFIVATPFWKSLYFWIPVLLLAQIIGAASVYKRFQKKQKLKQKEYEQQIRVATLEQQAYTSLLNPHFIFNSLNGIQQFLYSSKKEIAETYITRLTKLIRQSFELAQKTFVSLDDEIAHLNQYVFLEQQRYDKPFEFIISVEPEIDTEEVMIPTMLLQPLIENAIVHGRLQDNHKGLLELLIQEKDNVVCYTIRDNGVGDRKSESTSEHKSLGTQLISKRLHALGMMCNKEITLKFSTPFPDHEFTGFEVRFELPVMLYPIWKSKQSTSTANA